MRLSDLVKIDNRFEKSVNLLFDLNNTQKIKQYIPTRSSVKILTEYLTEVIDFTGSRASILIGPYGKGKSHLLLVLLAILSGNNEIETTELIERIAAFDSNAKVAIESVYRKKKLLPVVVNTNSGNLSQAFVRSLNQSLIREGLTDVVPDNYFNEAVKTINQWKEHYPDTYRALDANLQRMTVDELIAQLEQFDYDALGVFRRIHPSLTSGSDFNPLIEDEVLSIYQSVNRRICTDYSYDGMCIIFDEFSKYIEGHSEEGFSADMKILQDLCELCNSSKDEQIHLICVAHKAIRAYGDQLTKSIKNAFRGVEGRLIEKHFVVSSQNNYELIADAVGKTQLFEKWANNDVFNEMANASFGVAELRSLFEKKDFLEIVAKGAYPLTPLTSFLLLSLCEKIAQNERTVFTFLTGNDMYSLATFVKKNTSVRFAGADLVYDYFSQLMENEKDISVHNEWLKAEHALSKTEDDSERRVIKSLAVVHMVNRPDDLPGISDVLYLASGLEKKDVLSACERLVNAEVFYVKRGTGAFEFLNSISVNIGNAITDCASKYFSKINITSALNDIIRRKYILPKKFNQDNCITRHFRIQFMNYEAFMALPSTSYFEERNKPDGYVLVVLISDSLIIENIKHHAEEMEDPSAVVCYAIYNDDHKEDIRSLLAVKRLMNDRIFLEENEAAITELKSVETELTNELNQWADVLISGIGEVYTSNGIYSVGNRGINRTISDICEAVYSETPIINHELINRHNVSAQVSKARNNIMDDIFHTRNMEKYLSGTSAESTIYRALFVHTKDDKSLEKAKNIIVGYIHESKGKKVPFSKLYNALTKQPFGMRRGVIPIYISEQLMELEDMPVVYQDKKEISLDSQLMSNIALKPEDYSLYVEVETLEKLEYIENLEKLFEDYGNYCREIENRNRLSRLMCIMQSWYRSLPQTSITFKTPDMENQNIRKIIAFRKMFTDSPNPRELIFEKIPRLFSTTDYIELFKCVESIKQEIDSHIHKLKKRAEDAVRKEMSFPENDDFYRCLKSWYDSVPDNAKKSVLSTDSQRLFNAIRNLNSTDNEEIIEELSKASTNFFVEDWRDNMLDEFSDCVNSLIKEISEKSVQKADTGGKIIISDGKNEKELLYDFDSENMSSTGYFFKNALDEILEDYGDTLENSEKIGILMDTIKRLMG